MNGRPRTRPVRRRVTIRAAPIDLVGFTTNQVPGLDPIEQPFRAPRLVGGLGHIGDDAPQSVFQGPDLSCVDPLDGQPVDLILERHELVAQ